MHTDRREKEERRKMKENLNNNEVAEEKPENTSAVGKVPDSRQDVHREKGNIQGEAGKTAAVQKKPWRDVQGEGPDGKQEEHGRQRAVRSAHGNALLTAHEELP